MERAEKDTRIVVELNEDAGLLTTSIPFLLNTPPMKLHVSDTVYSGKAKLESEWFGIKEVSISINRQSGQGVSMYGVGDDIFTAFSGFCVLSEKL
ncbi:MAG TPA: hypothetical protein VJ577_03480 [Burkholderiaceae bacterium]|nr:hypothetical protein [Burkholderiaceae bacterium]